MFITEKNSSYQLQLWPILIFFMMALVGCTSETAPEICKELNSAIDRNIVEIAVTEMEGETSDKSAIQQGARLAQINNRLSAVNINVMLQGQNKCQPRQKPIDPSIYRSQASNCYLARLGMVSASYGTDEEKKAAATTKLASSCDFTSWNLQSTK